MRFYKVRFTAEAEDNLLRLYDFLVVKEVRAAERALEAIEVATRLLAMSP